MYEKTSLNSIRNLSDLRWILAILIGFVISSVSINANAHCDTMDGPVVKDAQAALEKADVTLTLKWVRAEDESEIREAFKKTLVVRTKGDEARDLADRYFFETLVRVHRAGEGAPYTGLKPVGTEVEPVVELADKALETGKEDDLVKLVTGQAAEGIHERFAHAREARQHAEESVEAGRRFVEAYVSYVHYAEGVYQTATSEGAHHGEGAHTQSTTATPTEHQHKEAQKKSPHDH